MKLKYFQDYYKSLKKDNYYQEQKITLKHYHGRTYWTGTIKEFCELTLHLCRFQGLTPINQFEVISFSHPAITTKDEDIPVWLRPIEIELI